MALPKLRAGVLPTLGAAVLWGTSFPVNQAGLEHMAPGVFVASRFALAALAILPFAWGLLAETLQRWEPWALGAVNAGAFLLQYIGQTTAPAGAAGLLVNANVVVVALVAWGWLGEVPTRRVWAAMGLAVLGASLIIYEPGGQGLQMGHSLVFLAGALWSLYIVGTRKALLEGHRTTSLALATFVTTGLLLSPFLVVQGLPAGQEAWLAVGYTGLFCTVGAFLLWLGGLRSVGATSSAVVLLVEVFVASLLGAWLLAESFGLRKIAGGLAIAASIVVLAGAGSGEQEGRQVRRRRQQTSAE